MVTRLCQIRGSFDVVSSLLTTKQSTKMPNKNKNNWLVAPQLGKLCLVSISVINMEIPKVYRHVDSHRVVLIDAQS